MATVKITVEFEAGVATRLPDLEVRAQAWNFVQRQNSEVKVFSTEHFGFDKRIEDLTVGRFFPRQLELEERDQQPPQSTNTVVVVLESPHREEYVQRQPLVRSRERLMRNVALLCGFFMPEQEADVIICNPIQWQASLAQYYEFVGDETPQDLLETVRNNVWEHIWNYRREDRYPARDYFITRVQEYQPLLLINACTTHLRHYTRTELGRIPGVPVVDTLHPACWDILRHS